MTQEREYPSQEPLIKPVSEARKHIKDNPQTLAEMLSARLGNHAVSPNITEYHGTPANLYTSDEIPPTFYDRLSHQNPNGYIVGIGVGGVLALLNGFTKENPPKGLIMADINPHVVATGRILTQKLAEIDNPNALVYSLFKMTNAEYEEYLKREGEKDQTLGRGMKNWKGECIKPYSQDIFHQHSQRRNVPHIPLELTKHFTTLKELSHDGMIASIYTDFKNPYFIDAVKSLPDFQTSLNVIYTTNSIDINDGPPGIKKFEDLRRYDNEDFPPIHVTSPISRNISMQIARSFDEMKKLYDE